MLLTHVEGLSAGALAHHILLIEDDAAAAESLKAMLELHGFRVQVAKDGGQAHSAFRMRRPDFIISDLILPVNTCEFGS